MIRSGLFSQDGKRPRRCPCHSASFETSMMNIVCHSGFILGFRCLDLTGELTTYIYLRCLAAERPHRGGLQATGADDHDHVTLLSQRQQQ